MGLECHAKLNPMGIVILFDFGKGIFHEVGPHAFFLEDLHYKIPMGLFSIGYVPINQTS